MKRIYLSMMVLAIAGSASAQIGQMEGPIKKQNSRLEKVKPVNNANDVEKVTIWSNDMSNASHWVATNNSIPAQDWFHTTDPADVPAAGPATMTTASNGYWLIDSDAAGQSANQDADITLVTPAILTGYNYVVLEFEQHYRTYQDERTVSVSTDGLAWTDYVVTDGTEGQINVDGTYAVNISSAVGGAATVFIKFNYVGNYGWHWAVDDVRIIEQPLDDVQLLTSWIVEDNNEGTEYGRYPESQLGTNWTVGGEIFNFGVNDATNVTLDVDFTSFSTTPVEPSLLADATVLLETGITPSLSTGLYQGTWAVTSDAETSADPEYSNNEIYRNFEVTDDIYSQDGIGIHPVTDLQGLGTNSFTGETDGLVLASWYHIKSAFNVEAIEIELGTGTVEGGELFVSIIDTVDFFAGDMTPVEQSNMFTITASDITNGYKRIYFDNVVTLNPGCYYAAVELYSGGGANHIVVLDDITVTQPFWSSAIFIPNDQSYTNGEALAIRLVAEHAGLDESAIDGVNVYPNPSTGLVNVSNAGNLTNTIEVFDVTGKKVLTKVVSTETSFDLSSNGAGVYVVKVSNEAGSMVERVVIK